MAISHDALVDGTLRKANSFVAKTVSYQKHKRFDIDKFLYKTEKGILDTNIEANPLLGVTVIQSDAPETVGTMELRLHITRQLDAFHDIGDVRTYEVDTDANGKVAGHTAIYKILPPSLRMTFEKNCRPLEAQDAYREQRRLNTRRPGTEPWAIFRFHYRTVENIDEQKLQLSCDPANKADDTETHTLALKPLPPLILGAKPQKNELETPSRASTPMIPTTPHPVKGAQMKPVAPPKRPIPFTNENKPEPKRTKVATKPRPVTPETVSMERRLSDQQMNLEKLRKKRIDQAKQQTKVYEQMTPYRELMSAELERLNQEIIEEEGAYSEEINHYQASIEVLRRFKKASSDI